jgi:hypothetical protein
MVYFPICVWLSKGIFPQCLTVLTCVQYNIYLLSAPLFTLIHLQISFFSFFPPFRIFSNVYLPPFAPLAMGNLLLLSNSLQFLRFFYIRAVIHNFPLLSKKRSLWFLTSYNIRVILGHYFNWQLLVATFCCLFHRINVAHSAGLPHARW